MFAALSQRQLLHQPPQESIKHWRRDRAFWPMNLEPAAAPTKFPHLLAPGHPSRSIGNVVGAALFADGHINVVPLLLGGTVGVLLQRLFAFKLHYDDVFVTLGKLHLDRLRPNILNTWIVDVLCRSYGPLDLFGRGTCLPLDGDHMNH